MPRPRLLHHRLAALFRVSLTATLLMLLGGCAHSPPAAAPADAAPPATVLVHDPAEPVNRVVFGFNRVLDTVLLKPLATAYGWLPEPVNDGVRNVVNNLGEPEVFINDVLQANGRRSANTLGRFVINSTVGLLGLFDVASHWHMPYHNADMGQTLGVWGVGNGPIVELPLFGSSNSRDAAGRVIGLFLDPFGGTDSDTVKDIKTGKRVAGTVDGRYRTLPLTERLEKSPDYYRALCDAIAQRRAGRVQQGRAGEVRPETPAAPETAPQPPL